MEEQMLTHPLLAFLALVGMGLAVQGFGWLFHRALWGVAVLSVRLCQWLGYVDR